jgi:hypothetical protein
MQQSVISLELGRARGPFQSSCWYWASGLNERKPKDIQVYLLSVQNILWAVHGDYILSGPTSSLSPFLPNRNGQQSKSRSSAGDLLINPLVLSRRFLSLILEIARSLQSVVKWKPPYLTLVFGTLIDLDGRTVVFCRVGETDPLSAMRLDS